MTRLGLSELFVTNLLLFEHHQKKKVLVSWQFSGPYGVTKYGSGWRKDVVNRCSESGVLSVTGGRHVSLTSGVRWPGDGPDDVGTQVFRMLEPSHNHEHNNQVQRQEKQSAAAAAAAT